MAKPPFKFKPNKPNKPAGRVDVELMGTGELGAMYSDTFVVVNEGDTGLGSIYFYQRVLADRNVVLGNTETLSLPMATPKAKGICRILMSKNGIEKLLQALAENRGFTLTRNTSAETVIVMVDLPPPSRITTGGTGTGQQSVSIITQSTFDIQSNTVTVVHSRDVSMPTVADEQKFRQLASKWREETRELSSDSDIAANFAYYQIIGMGERALPLIFEEIESHGGRWFWALRAITGENPVRREERGNVRRMTETWLEWARERNYV